MLIQLDSSRLTRQLCPAIARPHYDPSWVKMFQKSSYIFQLDPINLEANVYSIPIHWVGLGNVKNKYKKKILHSHTNSHFRLRLKGTYTLCEKQV